MAFSWLQASKGFPSVMGAVDFTPALLGQLTSCVVGAAMATLDAARTSRALDESP